MTITDAMLDMRAAQVGLQLHWRDLRGVEQHVSPAVVQHVLALLESIDASSQVPLLTGVVGGLAPFARAGRGPACWEHDDGGREPAIADAIGRWRCPARPGYWRWLQGSRMQAVAVAPQLAWQPWSSQAPPAWGLAAQVYGLRGANDGGIGDSQGSVPWLKQLARHGGQALAMSPVHLGMSAPDGYRPYSPSDRSALEPVHASPIQVVADAAMAVRQMDTALDARLCQHEQASLIDWSQAAADKRLWIRRIAAWMRVQQPDRWWQCVSSAVETGDVDERFAQWMAKASWQQAQHQSRALGMRIGLIADLAVGFDPAGREAQRHAGSVLPRLQLGAPPDAFNPHGQAWGITGHAPQALRAAGYAPFISLLRAVMADRGGLRIDHILGLQRLWVVPAEAGAGQGIYLQYPFEDLLNLLVLESWRHQCLVIGEDLGVVPAGIRRRLAARGVLGTDVLQFNHDEAGFKPLSQWRHRAVAMPSTHDLPTMAGWLCGEDLQWRQALGWTDAAGAAAAQRAREEDVAQLARRAHAEGIVPVDPLTDALSLVARAPAQLALLPLEDALGVKEQPNMPGTVDEHPNWKQRLCLPTDATSSLTARLAAFASARALAVCLEGEGEQEVDDE